MIKPEHEGVTSQPGYTLSKPSNYPNNRDHFNGRPGNARAGAVDLREELEEEQQQDDSDDGDHDSE